MAGESASNNVTTPAGAVFLSYASQDAEAAARICNALRATGIEVWFDQSELRGGDVWDQKIRREIHDCALFIPIISVNTASRREGYFRLEWDLADQRSHRMARDQAFIVPVCVDATPGAGTDVPESFHRVQWTRLPGGEAPPEFVLRIGRLLSREPPSTARLPAGAASGPSPFPLTTGRPSLLRRAILVAIAVLVLAAVAYLLINKPWISKSAPPVASNATLSPGAPPAAFTPPPHSIAVLPFVNLSGDPSQDYFSDGLTEELLNSLAEINELQVAARTSSFSFREHPDLATVARKLNVGAVLEGSVRRSGHTVRVTAQLINAVTGFHLWSKTYDRDSGDVLKLQTEIAHAVASALQITLLEDAAARIEVGGTRNPAALDAYLRARKAHMEQHDAAELHTAITLYEDALRLDPSYALALVGRSLATLRYFDFATGPPNRAAIAAALADASKAVALAPDLGDAHLALAVALETTWPLDFKRMSEEYERARTLSPGSVLVQRFYSSFAANMGRTDAAVTAASRAIVLDPLSPLSYRTFGNALSSANRYDEAIAAYTHAIALDPDVPDAAAGRGLAYYALGQFEQARLSCDAEATAFPDQVCLAMTYHKLGRHADAESMLTKMKALQGDAVAYDYATIYAQWGNTPKALEWLETALRLQNTDLESLKTDPLMDPLRKEPRFQAVMRELKFPG